MRIFAKVPNINFMAQRKTGLLVSSVLSIISILLLVFHGLNLGIDFTGGVIVQVTYPQTVQLDSVRESLKKGGYDNSIVQFFGTSSDVLIRLPAAKDSNTAETSSKIMGALGAVQGCGSADHSSKVCVTKIDFVGPQVGEELTVNGSIAMLAAFAMIMMYIAFRFEWKFSVGAIAALMHDATMVLGFLSATWVEFDLTTLAAILALIGYSNNETIVIFDRVRENLINLRKTQILDVVNLSVNQTLLRSVITHLTTLLVSFALLLLGGHSVHSFSIAMIVGVIVATYSSIYISTGIAVALGISREDLLPPKDDELEAAKKKHGGAVV
jgi:preprotein translocase subunit SecF